MTILAFIASYIGERSVSRDYIKALFRVGKAVATVTGENLDDLSAAKLNPWLASLEASGPVNAANVRRMVKTIWTAAHEEGLAPSCRGLRKIKVPKKIPEALRLDEILRLVQYAEKMKGNFRGTKCSRRLYWRSLFMAYYDSALRVGDLRSIERQWIASGIFSIVQHKPNSVHRVRLRHETMAAIDEYLDGRTQGPIWSRLNRKNFFVQLRKIFDAAGVRGSSKWIRRASASYVERERPGTGWRHLGHAKPGLAESNYLDPSICGREPSLPPSIWG